MQRIYERVKRAVFAFGLAMLVIGNAGCASLLSDVMMHEMGYERDPFQEDSYVKSAKDSDSDSGLRARDRK